MQQLNAVLETLSLGCLQPHVIWLPGLMAKRFGVKCGMTNAMCTYTIT